MRSRIIPTVPETVLSYNIGDKSAALEKALAPLGIKHIAIPADKAGETVGYLCGYGGFASNGSSVSADGECAIFSGISGKRLDTLLKAMRSEGVDIPLKAVVTAHNMSKSIEWLLSELAAERDAIAKASAK